VTSTVAGGAVFAADKLTVTYPNGAVGTDGVDLSVQAGSIVAVLGRNGAGKTSLLRAVAGFLRSEHVSVGGELEFAGHRVTGASPGRMHRLGVVFVPERDKVFPSLSVEDNLKLVTPPTGASPDFELSFEPIARRMSSRAGMLSGGERQMLALSMAARQAPKLLLVDELSLGLAPVIVKDLMTSLRRLVDDTGVPVVLVEQDASAALHIADRVAVMDRGQIVWEGASSETNAGDISSRYLGVTR
jgi:ABC-type branched-subunit amino acid transport system ATPase component